MAPDTIWQVLGSPGCSGAGSGEIFMDFHGFLWGESTGLEYTKVVIWAGGQSTGHRPGGEPHEAETLDHGKHLAGPPKQPRSPQNPESYPESSRWGTGLGGRRPRSSNQITVGHPRGAGRFTAQALDTGIHGLVPLVVGLEAFPLHCPHQRNPAPR